MLRDFFGAIAEQPFRAEQVLRWVHRERVVDFQSMTNLPASLRERLAGLAHVSLPTIAGRQTSADGTIKWLVRLGDGNAVEMVYIPEPERATLCISSQAGCALNCSFCATARQGFSRNLTAAEIIAQVWLAGRALAGVAPAPRAISNVVLMGMGEPLLNLDNVLPALALMLDDLTYGLSRRRVTVSTAGVVPGIDRLREHCPVSLAVSLHAPEDALRDRLVPLNRKYPIATLLEACRRYVAGEARRRVTFEYTLLAGVNDDPEQARKLAGLLGDIPSKVNLIPFNTFPGAPYRRPESACVDRFRDELLARGIFTITRRTRGAEIDAACGQLAGRIQDRTRRSRSVGGVH